MAAHSQPTVRPRKCADLAACVRILEAVHRADGYPSHWPEDAERWLTPRGLLGAWVAEVDGVIAGHVALRSGDAPAEITRLFVAGGYRRLGVGRALLGAACRDALGPPVIEVVDTNRSAVALYEREGWTLVDSEPWADATEPDVLLLRYAAPRG